MNITIIGTGLIGGSFALALRGFQTHIIGVNRRKETNDQALQLGIVDEVLPLESALPISDLVIIAVPVDATCKILPSILDQIGEKTVVVDAGSTKLGICDVIRNHAHRANFVASHPIAGTENSGPSAAFSTLFMDKMTIICEKELSAPFALEMVEKMYNLLSMKILYMKPKAHDRHIAYVSHISHITSFALALAVLDIEKDEATIFNMAGSGFASTVRLAKSSPDMWSPIFTQNAENLTEALDAYIIKLQEFREVIASQNTQKAHTLMSQANDIRRILEGIK